MKRRRIAYGVSNWAELVRECHFVDKTAHIRTLEAVKTPVFLRPKRFGKSLVCSMLAHYYDIDLKDRFDEFFGATDIGRDPTPLRNSFLVLPFDFSTVQVGSLAEIERNFFENVRGAVGCFVAKYAALADWSAVRAAANPADCIDRIRSVIKAARLPPLYVIVDEYDNFTNELVVTNRDAEYGALCGHDAPGDLSRESFFKTFFKSFKAGLADGTVGRTYFTGVLPITLDDLSSGFNVGTVVSLNPELIDLVGFTERQLERYLDEIYEDRGFDAANRSAVLADLKAFYDGYRFVPNAEPLYNATICNWYLFNLVSNNGSQPMTVIDANIRTDIGWFRRLTRTNERALEKVRGYIERGRGESGDVGGLSAKFGRTKFFTEAFFPYALYYLGLLTFEDEFTLNIPNLTLRNMFVDYYDELCDFANVDEAREQFIGTIREFVKADGSWRAIFDAYWRAYVKARVPAQAYDKMNENFFRTTFTSRCLDVLPMFYSFETEYNTPEGRCDFLAVPKPGVAKPARLIEFKYFTNDATRAGNLLGRNTPDEDTLRQAERYRDALRRRPDWSAPIETSVVEICGNQGYNWFEVEGSRETIE